ncbi:sulfate adenylyltransferase subunit CysN [Alcaligenaceae bacterium LF4-65]|uniref:Multifunctional fusion protein n=1 Tax=Zwartia hollandica TaxID=324606 RepID=A0A953NB04_9BURK|nr:sulfate adenylyltransferase subunit CysN [Zwartia hollandica]MBZ1351023.1 sulfate adenylyltransferase subunit CysN [Zwartia hollandica]
MGQHAKKRASQSLDTEKRLAARHLEQPATIEAFLAQQKGQDLLRFITCGSVDDGKSTLIGRLLWEAQQLFDDQLAALQADSKKHGTQGEDIDFALLVDGLAAEREQGITIDVAYRFFATSKRKFIVADTPGHEQYTRNMVTGASTADVAILLVDARAGLLVQTRRHAFLTSLMGIKKVVLAVNKMDLVGYSTKTFAQIKESFESFALTLGFETITAIPISALKGDNITERSAQTPWYQGPTLMGYLDTVEINTSKNDKAAFPVQWVNRPNSDFRGFSGTLAQGRINVGNEIRVTASGQTAIVADIVTMDGSLASANAGDAITLCLDREIDASQGDVLSLASIPLEMTDQFEATIVWMHQDHGMPGRNYDLKLSSQWAGASITNIKYRIDINTLAQVASKSLKLNDISVCTLSMAKPIVFAPYTTSPTLGGFILVDRFTHATVAAGMIRHNLRRAQNIHKQALSITRPDRERLNGHKGKVIWFTGLSGSGKSTLANALEVELHTRGMRTYILDGDNIRHGLNKDLGFTDADRVENIRRIAEVAKLMMDAGIIVMTAFISPFKREREMARELIGAESFVEVYVSTSLEVCEQRDVKGLYKQARSGKIPNMTGISSPYELPKNPEFVADTAKMSVKDVIYNVARLVVLA